MNEHTRTLLRCIYWAHVASGFDRDMHIEAWLEIGDLEDLLINASSRDDAEEFKKLFSTTGRVQVLKAFNELRAKLNGKPFQDCEFELAALTFMQFIAARGMWQHRLDVGDELDRFARRFDRLDVPSERERLHLECQVSSSSTRTLH
mgnify:FL=1